LDGKIVYGEALVSSEHVTGEGVPVRKGQGDQVPAGALNHDGVLVIQTTQTAEQSTPARIAALTRNAQVDESSLFWEPVSLTECAKAFCWRAQSLKSIQGSER